MILAMRCICPGGRMELAILSMPFTPPARLLPFFMNAIDVPFYQVLWLIIENTQALLRKEDLTNAK